jgi:hypothetical protein
MTDTPAESAEDPRTPQTTDDDLRKGEAGESAFAAAIREGHIPCGLIGLASPSASSRQYAETAYIRAMAKFTSNAGIDAIEEQIRAALAALNAQWKEALLQYEGCAFWIAAEQHSCAKCAPLRALLSEGKPGK